MPRARGTPRAVALAAGAQTIALPARDPDVPLSARGLEQAHALGRWLGREVAASRPTASRTSPYRRTRETAATLAGAAGWVLVEATEAHSPVVGPHTTGPDSGDHAAIRLVVDERLREKDPGRLEGLTRAGIIARHPAEAEAYGRLGKFYYRPPGGESWCDVILRLRSLMEALRAEHRDGRVLIVAHQVVVVCLRYILEGLDEAGVLDLERPGEVANASLTSYRRAGGRLVLEVFNAVGHLVGADAPITAEPPAVQPIDQTGAETPRREEPGAHPGGGHGVPAEAPDLTPLPAAGSGVGGAEERTQPGDRYVARADGEARSRLPRGDPKRSPAQLITRRLLARWTLPEPDAGDDKEARGRVLIVGGDARVPGGAILAAMAALRAGAGKPQLAVAAPVAAAIGVAVPEARVQALPATPDGAPDPDRLATLERQCGEAAAVVIGPGLVDPATSGALVQQLAGWVDEGILLVDAAALAGVTEETSRRLDGQLLLTPNAGEMAKLLDWSRERVEADPACAARSAAARFGAVVLKGRETWIAERGGRLYLNRAGNVGLAVSGSGDALAGLIGGLLARGAAPVQAAVWAVHLHGLLADRLARLVGPLGYLPRELPDGLPALLAALDKRRRGARRRGMTGRKP